MNGLRTPPGPFDLPEQGFLLPMCPSCGLRLVFVVTATEQGMEQGWQCDCNYVREGHGPPGLTRLIRFAREDGPATAVSYNARIRQEMEA